MEPRRFVLLLHEPGEAGPRELHWDLMLEFGDGLRTWALANEPSSGDEITADELPRHRTNYLDYEGTISGGRGTVRQLDRGTFRIVEETPDKLFVELLGASLTGRLQLTRDANTQRWIALFTPS